MHRLLIILVLLIASPRISLAATIGFDPAASEVALNEVFTIDITGSNFPTVEGGGVSFFFEQTIVNVLSVNIDTTVWSLAALPGTIDNLAGEVSDILVATFDDPSPDFVVATIELQAIGLGNAQLTLTETVLNRWSSSELLLQPGSGSSLVNPAFVPGSVTVSPIPLPAAAWLFGSAMLALVGFRRRSRAYIELKS